jgi:hypothetical protein
VVVVVLVVIEVESAGRSSTFAHAASARASETAAVGRMTFIGVPVWACLCAGTSETSECPAPGSIASTVRAYRGSLPRFPVRPGGRGPNYMLRVSGGSN